MSIKKVISIVLSAVLMLSCITVVQAQIPKTYEDTVLFSESFDDNQLHNSFTAKTGTIENGAYILNPASGTNTKDGSRLLYAKALNKEQRSGFVSSGIYSAECTVKFLANGDCPKVFAVEENTLGAYNAFNFRTIGAKLYLEAYAAADADTATKYELLTYDLNTDYNIKVYINIDNGELQLTINNTRYLASQPVFINKIITAAASENMTNNVNRFFDSNNSNGYGKFSVDNIAFKKQYQLPYSSYEPLFKEDFSSFSADDTNTADGYGAKVAIAANVADFTAAADTNSHGKVLNVNNSRLLKVRSGMTAGKYMVSTDVYMNTNVTGTLLRGTNSTATATDIANNLATNRAEFYKVEAKNGYFSLTCSSTNDDTTDSTGAVIQNATRVTYDFYKFTVGQWYTVAVSFDIDTGIIKLYVDGQECMVNSAKYVIRQKNYNRFYDADNRSTSGFCVDNITLSNAGPDTSSYLLPINGSNFDTGNFNGIFSTVVSVPTAKNGYVSFAPGNRALYQTTVCTSGVYTLEADVNIPATGVGQSQIFNSQDKACQTYYTLYALNGAIVASSFDKDGVTSVATLVSAYDTAAWYNIKVDMNTVSKRLHFYVNGIEVATDMEFYMSNPKGGKDYTVYRAYDINNNGGKFTVNIDNLKFYEDKLAEELALDSGVLVSDLTLPSALSDGTAVNWLTSDYSTLSSTGTVGVAAAEDKFVQLTAICADGSTRSSKNYVYYIPKIQLEYPNQTGITEDLNDLPFVTADGSLVTWNSSNPEIITNTGAVTRPAETTTVTLTGTYAGTNTVTVSVEVLGMNTENKLFIVSNEILANGTALAGKVDINGKKLVYDPLLYNATDAAMDVTPIIAMYEEDRLEAVVFGAKQSIASKAYSTAFGDVSVTVPAEGEYSVHAFLWDSVTSLKPISEKIIAADKNATLYVVGDSTFCTYPENAEQSQAGIGMYLSNSVNSAITVANHAVGGRSSRSFLMEGRLTDVLNAASAGDYMQIEWGINDTTDKEFRFVSADDFDDYLSIYVNAARDRGIIPYFVTAPLTGKYDSADGTITYSASVEERRSVMRDAAMQMNVPLADLSLAQAQYFETLSVDEIYNNFYIKESDNLSLVHYNQTSAALLAQKLADLIRQADVNGLSGYIN